jgi:hypothetical protein
LAYIRRIEHFFERAVDSLIRWKYLLVIVVTGGLGALIHYYFDNSFHVEHIPTYLFFGIASVLGFFISYRILFYIKPVLSMEQYLEYLIEILKNTTLDDELIILASTPNPGLSEFIELGKPQHHNYLEYKYLLTKKINENKHIKYRILQYDSMKSDCPMMKFLEDFLKNLNAEQRAAYLTELKRLMEDIESALEPTAPQINDKKGFLIIYHPRMGFMGVYDAQGGVLKIRGVKVGEAIFLNILKEVSEYTWTKTKTANT